MQGIALMEPILAKAARKLGIDQVAIRKHQRSRGQGAIRARRFEASGPTPPARLSRKRWIAAPSNSTGSERVARNPKRIGTKVRGVGVSMSCYVGGSIGFDGLMLIKPDGSLCFQSGIGNLGTESVIDVHRVAAEMLGVPWEKCDVCWGTNAKNLPWSCVSGGSQTTHAMTRAAHAVARRPRSGCRKSPPRAWAGSPENYDVGNETRLPQRRRRQHDAGPGRAEGHSDGRHLRRA